MEPPSRQRARSLGDMSRTTRTGVPSSIQVRLEASIAGLKELHLLRESQKTLIEQAKSLMCRNKDTENEKTEESEANTSSRIKTRCTDAGVRPMPGGQDRSWRPALQGTRPRALSLSVLPSKFIPPAGRRSSVSLDNGHDGDMVVQSASNQKTSTEQCSSRVPMRQPGLSLDIAKRKNIVLSQNLEEIDRELTGSGRPPGMVRPASDSKLVRPEIVISATNNIRERGPSPCVRRGSFTFGVSNDTTVKSDRRSSLCSESSGLQADYKQPRRLSGSGPSYNFPSPMHAVLLQYDSTSSKDSDVIQPATYSGSHLDQALANTRMEGHAISEPRNICVVRSASDADSCTSSDTITSETMTILDAKPSNSGTKVTNYEANTSMFQETEPRSSKQVNSTDNERPSRDISGFRDLFLDNEHDLNTDVLQNQSQIGLSNNSDSNTAFRLCGDSKVKQKRKRVTCTSVTSSEEGYFSSQPSTPRSRRHKLSIQSDISFASTGSSFILPEFSDEEKGMVDSGRDCDSFQKGELTKEDGNNLYRCPQITDVQDTSV